FITHWQQWWSRSRNGLVFRRWRSRAAASRTASCWNKPFKRCAGRASHHTGSSVFPPMMAGSRWDRSQQHYGKVTMCLAVPGKLMTTNGEGLERTGRVNFGGVVKEASLAYVPEAQIGDYVIV